MLRKRGVVAVGAMVIGILLPQRTCAQAVEVDFERDWMPFSSAPDVPGRVWGEIAHPFRENSSGWAEVEMEISRIGDAFAGTSAMRVDVRSVESGQPQLWIPGLPVESGRYARLRMAVRAPASGYLRLGIRTQGEPWRHVWERGFRTSPEWRVYEEIIPPMQFDPATSYALMVYLDEGVTDFDAFHFQYVREEDLAAEGREGMEGNLLPSGSFPLGLHRPWSLAAHHDGAEAHRDAQTKGPTGQPALKLVPGLSTGTTPRRPAVELVSPAIPLQQFHDHTFSFFAKGSEQGQRMEVRLYGHERWRPVARQTFTIGDPWDRYQLSHGFSYVPDGFWVARIATDKELWVDGLQAEVGASASALARRSEVELVLAEAAPFGLFQGEEDLSIRVATVGARIEGGRLEGSLVDPYGEKSPVSLAWDPPAESEGTLLALPDHQAMYYGTFRLELRLHDAAGEPVSDWSETIVHRVRPARMLGQDAPGSPFGIHVHPKPDHAAMVKKLGFNWVRVHNAGEWVAAWYFLEQERGSLDFSQADPSVAVYRDRDLMILGLLDTAPPWYTEADSHGATPNWYRKYYVPKEAYLGEWARYARETAEHFAGRIDHWEIWNEPYVRDFFRLTNMPEGGFRSGTPADYVPLLEVASQAAREGNPNARIMGSNQAAGWAEGLAEHEAHRWYGAASFHHYTWRSGMDFIRFDSALENMRRVLPEERRSMAFWNTEGGPGGANNLHIMEHTGMKADPHEAQENAEFLVRYQLGSLVQGVERFFLYTFHTHGWWPDWNLLLPDGGLPPHATAQSSLFWHVEGKTFQESVALHGRFDAYVFAGAEEDVVALVQHRRQAPPLKLGTDLQQAVVRDLYGNVRPLPQELASGIWYLTVPAGQGVAAARQLDRSQ